MYPHVFLYLGLETVLFSSKIMKTRYLGSTAGFRTNMTLKNMHLYPEAENNVFLKIKPSYGSKIYNYIVALVAISTSTSKLRETEMIPEEI